MPPKAKSATTSSRSATSKPLPATGGAAKAADAPPRPDHPQDTPLQFVKGVGPGLGGIFASRDFRTVKDLLFFFPRAYEDRSKLLRISELSENAVATVAVQVVGVRNIPVRGRFGKGMLEVRCTDESGAQLALKWFHAPRGMEQRFKPGVQVIVTGTVKKYMGRSEIVHPEISWGVSAAASPAPLVAPLAGAQAPSSDAAASADFGRIVPIYTEIEGVSSRVLRKVLWEALDKYASALSEDLPPHYLEQHGLPRLAPAVRSIHFPPDAEKVDGPAAGATAADLRDRKIADLLEFNTPAHHRLIYEEFFKFEYLVLRQRLRMERALAPAIGGERGVAAARELEATLPFKLTGGQGRAVEEILGDFAKSHPMNRLIQGDVGSGKTAVAFVTAGCALAAGGQAALMAPTEILAEQHFKNAVKLFGGRLNVVLLTGKTTAAERGKLLPRLAGGEPLLLIGTHALIEDAVVFANLVYNMVDEQHRFGVDQRRTLRNKGMRKDPVTGKVTLPHTLILTATPIPRTLALTAYGDLSVTSITELPPGRTPIATRVVRDKAQAAQAYERIRQELRAGHQAYFIYPLVKESEAEGFTQLKSAVAEAERLQKEVFPDFKVGLLHGQMRPDEKAAVMDAFKRHELHVLVSTTVVEVGVDVPNATIMVIEHAERFGLSQLHQLRGRVGRGAKQSYCFLFAAQKTGETTAMRLEVLEETGDGFKIAEADLEIRGPGEFLGTRQAGGLPFRLANIVRDREWLIRARDDASALLKEDPELLLPQHASLRKYYEREGRLQFDRLKTS
jgi:ATP-dependent DNA helicase RecG